MKQLIWDLPTRLFHWGLGGSILAAYALAQLADKETPLFYLHVVFAVLAGLLMVWRIFWGIFGSRHSKFSNLFFSPQEIISYFKEVVAGKGRYYAGHNPGGAIVILIMFALILIVLFSGVMTGINEAAEEVHEVVTNLLIIAVVFHVIGVLLATFMHKEKYILSMFNGKKTGSPEDGISKNHSFEAIIMLLLVGSGWLYFIKGFDRETAIFTAPGTQWSFQVGEPSGEDLEDDDSNF